MSLGPHLGFPYSGARGKVEKISLLPAVVELQEFVILKYKAKGLYFLKWWSSQMSRIGICGDGLASGTILCELHDSPYKPYPFNPRLSGDVARTSQWFPNCFHDILLDKLNLAWKSVSLCLSGSAKVNTPGSELRITPHRLKWSYKVSGIQSRLVACKQVPYLPCFILFHKVTYALGINTDVLGAGP